MEKLFIVKIGGNVLDNDDACQLFLNDFAAISGLKILIHGGGKIASKIGEQLGIQANYVKGRRITDEKTRDLVTMVYGGLINKQLVAQLQQRGCNALGMTGADGAIITAVKRPVREVDFGFVGDIVPAGVNARLLNNLLEQQIVPVLAPLTLSNGEILNTNADTIASVLAVVLSKDFFVRLIYCFDKKGVLKDVNDDNSVISRIDEKMYHQLISQNALADGIIPKIENAFDAINSGVQEILIGAAEDIHENTTASTKGTLIFK